VILEREGEHPAGTAAVNAAKLFANRIAMEVTDRAMQAVGGRAYLRPHPLERLCRDARAGALMRNTLDQCREEIARAVLGHIPAEGRSSEIDRGHGASEPS
jgi:alkylation response protein AidB-like acyl-CoA dehydrogenase